MGVKGISSSILSQKLTLSRVMHVQTLLFFLQTHPWSHPSTMAPSTSVPSHWQSTLLSLLSPHPFLFLHGGSSFHLYSSLYLLSFLRLKVPIPRHSPSFPTTIIFPLFNFPHQNSLPNSDVRLYEWPVNERIGYFQFRLSSSLFSFNPTIPPLRFIIDIISLSSVLPITELAIQIVLMLWSSINQ